MVNTKVIIERPLKDTRNIISGDCNQKFQL